MTVRIAIIGAGAIGVKHAQAAQAAGCSIEYVIDANADRASALAEKFGARSAIDAEASLHDTSVDGVVVCVPNCYHKRLAIDAMRAGKDVLLEKPMALNEADCREINGVAQLTGRVVQLAFVHRYTAVGQLAKSLAVAQSLGEIYHAKAHLYFRRGVPGLGKWFTTKQLSGGGAMIDVGVHLIDLAMHVLEFPIVDSVCGQVYAKFGSRMEDYVYENMWAGPPNRDGVFDVEDSAHAFIRYTNGATLDLQVAWAGNFPKASVPTSMMGFFGERGGITFELFGDHVNHSYEENGAIVDARLPAPETDPFKNQFIEFANSIETRKVHGPTGAEGQVVQSIVDAIYRSSLPLAIKVAV